MTQPVSPPVSKHNINPAVFYVSSTIVITISLFAVIALKLPMPHLKPYKPVL